MSFASTSQTTEEAREINPKAVFFGSDQDIITPLGLYLSKRNVELFTGNDTEDALFGDYLFYVGDASGVKPFIEKIERQLPKALFIITAVSDKEKLLATLKDKNVKVLFTKPGSALASETIEKIMTFYFAGRGQVLQISEPDAIEAMGETQVKNKTENATETQTQRMETTEKDLEEFTDNKKVDEKPDHAKVADKDIKPELESVKIEGKINSRILPAEKLADLPTLTVESEVKSPVKNLFMAQPKLTGGKGFSKAPFVTAVIILIALVVTPIVLTTGALLGGSVSLLKAKTSFEKGNATDAYTSARTANAFFSFSQHALTFITPLLEIAHIDENAKGFTTALLAANELAQGLVYSAKLFDDAQGVTAAILDSEKTAPDPGNIANLKANLALADTHLAQAQAYLKNDSLENLNFLTSAILPGGVAGLRTEVATIREKMVTGNRIISLLPELIGLYGERSYLAVFQNNLELRPTGGFIGSYGIVNFKNGKMTQFSIDDIYTADGALQGHVEPPEPLKKLMNTEHWYMRDANWDPDFSQAAPRLLWFLDKETGVQADGVFALDLYTVEQLLKLVGPVTVADFQEEITADNLFSKTHSLIEDNFFPGSTQKKDFLSSLLKALLFKDVTRSGVSQVALVSLINDALSQKHVLAYFTQPQLQALVVQSGWAGNLADKPCSDECQKDFLYVVDANIGVNKTNYFIKRSVTDSIEFSADDEVVHTLRILYENSATQESKVGGTYKNYTRTYVPLGSEVTAAAFNDQPLNLTNDAVASNSAIATTKEKGFTVIAGYIEVLPQTKAELVYTYVLPPQSDSFSRYQLTVLKQPGTVSDSYVAKVVYPPRWELRYVNNVAPDVAGAVSLVNETEFSYNTALWEDTKLEFEFGKQ